MPNDHRNARGTTEPAAEPHVPAEQTLPEITFKAIVLGLLLAAILAGANAYLGLFAGMTVSASIPAAVISMAVLRLFRTTNILENNIVQTAASAGESVAAGAIFTLPALVIMGYWDDFHWGWTTAICGVGGLVGVLFSIPLRRALIVEQRLRFPEGVATAEVLKTGEKGSTAGVRRLAAGGAAGGLVTIGGAAGLWGEVVETATRAGGSILYFGSNLSPALLSVGYIVGLNIAVLIFAGGALNWLVAIPIYAASHPWPEGTSALEWAGEIWSSQTRYIGVGSMLVGGLWSLVSIRRALVSSFRMGLRVAQRAVGAGNLPRTEQDTPSKWVAILLGIAAVPVFALYVAASGDVVVGLLMTVLMLFAGFLFSAVASYMAGLVGSSNNPVSGMTIATILSASLLLVALMGPDAAAGPAAAILIGAVVCCAAAIGGDNMQDLKAGHILGATPWRQQIMQALGAVGGAAIMAPVLMLLLRSNGFGAPTPEHPDPLAAPQAMLMASVARGVFEGNLPWLMVGIGAALGVLIIVADEIQGSRGASFRVPILAVAVGVYLPFELTVPIFVGGVVAMLAARRLRALPLVQRQPAGHQGLLFASGLITGEALTRILIALVIVVAQSATAMRLAREPFGYWPCVLLVAGIALWLYRIASQRPATDAGGEG